MQFFKSLYIHSQFFAYIAIISATFLLSYWVPTLYKFACLLALLLAAFLLVDVLLLYRFKNAIKAHRTLSEKLSNSDDNLIPISIVNHYPFPIYAAIIDELPFIFQKRDFLYQKTIVPNKKETFNYTIKPTERGSYKFGNLILFASTAIRIIARKYTFDNNQSVAVYPSYLQMQKYDFLAITKTRVTPGIKKIRKIGHTFEFEQIKEYVPGNDIRTINWKATAKQGNLMVNQYQDEKAQPIYSIIDTSRVMKMPFEGLKLLDYAINATLSFSNVAIKKHDKVGLISFSNTIEKTVPAKRKITHLQTLIEALYKIDTNFLESDFGVLYAHIKKTVSHRSLLLLFTNFEHITALERQLPYLKALNKKHLLVVIFFKNTELDKLIFEKAKDVQSIYHKTIAEKFKYDKIVMVKELQKHGIQSILTKPEKLTVNTINKYLEIKARGVL